MGDGEIIHLIDSDPEMLDAMRRLLQGGGHDCRAHAAPAAFLDAIDGAPIGCLVTEARLPGMSGLDLLAALKARGLAAPAVVVGANADIPTAVAAMKLGAFDFLEKPFCADVLLAAVRAALKHRRETAASEAEPIRERFTRLSKRETQVLERLVRGDANKIIAHELGISVRTVEVHRANLMTKMKAGSLVGLVKMSVIAGRGAPPSPRSEEC